MVDHGFTHIAIGVSDLDRSMAFYADYAGFEAVHQRTDAESGHRVAWISDLTRPFVIVLMENGLAVLPIGGFNHLGVGVSSRAEVDRLAEKGRTEGHQVLGPLDYGPPVGYWAIITDPDGHNLEVAFGQEVGLVVDHVVHADAEADPAGDIPPRAHS